VATNDTSVSIHPYFEIHEGREAEFKAIAERCVAATRANASDERCQHYGFSYDRRMAFCREAYADAQGLLTHLGNIKELLGAALQVAELSRLEVHASEEQLALLREPLAELAPRFFVLECGFRA
jgi:hypothetical protein